jgi:mono/diheme cytochrome c family protein
MAAGGVPIPTPFGTIFSANITPDPEHGIGGYTRAEFHDALRNGRGRGGRNLYPAMPYIYTQITTPEDIDALYAYFMSIPPIASDPPANTGAFMLPVRPFMDFWNLLNFPRHAAPDDPARSAAWNRGAYLVEGLGHCGGCHTPPNFMMGARFDKPLEGGAIEGYDVPAITPAALTARGYDLATLSQYLGTGIAPQGTSYAGMYTVTHFSTSAMDEDDVAAVATYLLTGPEGEIAPPAPPPEPLPQAAAPAGAVIAPGHLVYMEACAGCHGGAGEGIPNVAPAMKGNSTVALESPRNLVKVVIEGIPTQAFPGGQRMYAMPPFTPRLSDAEIADLASWMRAEWGGQGAAVTAAQVNDLKR